MVMCKQTTFTHDVTLDFNCAYAIAHVIQICKYANVISCKIYLLQKDDSVLNRNIQF
jgi:hypothetical protein